MPGSDLLDLIDQAIAVLTELRAALVASQPAASGNGFDADPDFAPEHLIEISTAAHRFDRPADTLRYCENCGVKIGGRWMASPRAIRRKLGME